MPVQGVTFVPFHFGRKFQMAILASVAVDMITAIHGDNAQRFFFAFLRHDRSMTMRTTWGEFVVKATDAMRGVVGIDRERHSIQATSAR